jgi:hypothetical protein
MKTREGLSENYPQLTLSNKLTLYYNKHGVCLYVDMTHKILLQVSYGEYYIKQYKSIESLKSGIIKDKEYFSKIK